MINPIPHDREGHPVGEVLIEVGTSAKELIQSEIELARSEIKESAATLGRHTGQAALFGALLGISVFPLLAFVIIGLGKLLGDNYWLSSLAVGVLCAVIGGLFTYRAYQKLKQEDFTLPHTRRTLERDKNLVKENVRDIRNINDRRAI